MNDGSDVSAGSFWQRQHIICATKKRYDSEFEAQRAAWRYENKSGDEMVVYKCTLYPHFHISHKDKNKRRGYGKGWKKCVCGEIFSTKKTKKKVTSDLDLHQMGCEIYKRSSREQG